MYSGLGGEGMVGGASGVEGTPPSNYNDHNVFYRVPDHFSHHSLKENGGVMDLVAGDFQRSILFSAVFQRMLAY